MKHIVLTDWPEFEESLRANLDELGHTGLVIARNFATSSMTPDLVETNRLELVLGTGTDRSADSPFWNEPGFDHDHAGDPKGKQPQDIAYAFTLDLAATPYLVLHDAQPSSFDITEGLTPYDGIVVYHPRGLDRVSKNEYWFTCDPLDVALLVFTLGDIDGEIYPSERTGVVAFLLERSHGSVRTAARQTGPARCGAGADIRQLNIGTRTGSDPV